MDNFNKVLSFILGLVVVIVFFAVLTGRLSFKRGFPFVSIKATPTAKLEISPTKAPTPTPVSSVVVSSTTLSSAFSSKETSSYNRYQKTTKTPSSIPSTGSPTLLLPFFISTLGLGFYLRKKA
mgnify:CR=1 FL=1